MMVIKESFKWQIRVSWRFRPKAKLDPKRNQPKKNEEIRQLIPYNTLFLRYEASSQFFLVVSEEFVGCIPSSNWIHVHRKQKPFGDLN